MTPARSVSDLAIGTAAITALEGLSVAQLLAAVTPERVGELTGYSASSVRYRLNSAAEGGVDRGWSFDREQLLAAGLRTHQARANARWSQVHDRTLDALDALEAGATEPISEQLARLVEDGGAHGRAASTPWHRLLLLATAGAPTSPLIAGLLREIEAERRQRARPLLARALEVLGREPLRGPELDSLGDALNSYLLGTATRRRADPQAGRAVLRDSLALTLGLSRPTTDGPAPAVTALIRAATAP